MLSQVSRFLGNGSDNGQSPVDLKFFVRTSIDLFSVLWIHPPLAGPQIPLAGPQSPWLVLRNPRPPDSPKPLSQ